MVEDMGEFGTGVTPPPGDAVPARKSRSKVRGAAAGVGVALVVGVGGLAVAAAATPSSGAGAGAAATEGAPTPAPTHSGEPGRPGGRGPGGFGGFGGFGPAGGLGGVVHGTYVVAKPGGGYQTIQTQTGTVDAVSSTSIKVTSKDGFAFTYVVKAGTNVDAQRDGISSVKKGDAGPRHGDAVRQDRHGQYGCWTSPSCRRTHRCSAAARAAAYPDGPGKHAPGGDSGTGT